MKELVVFLAQSLVDKPDAVRVEVVESDKSMIYQLHVDNEDVGKVIGKQGRIAKAMRTIVKASAVKDGKKAIVEIID